MFAPATDRLRLTLCGAVQGVGFRPFVYRLATELGLCGWVRNSSSGLEIEVEGSADRLAEFERRLFGEKPAPAVVVTNEISRLAPIGFASFEIRDSDESQGRTAAVLPDLATCSACLADLLDPANRRFGYPFTNCTWCGPRYSIVLDIPYDRPNTTMRAFTLCPECRREYEEPTDRRFHAQPNACPICGPRLSAEVHAAAETLGGGQIVALKGVGGFQLLVDARNEDAVVRLRRRKHREEKPFAMMMPGLDVARRYCRISAEEAALLLSPAAPIVLVEPAGAPDLAPSVAKNSPYLGVMLPYSPLHHLLMRAFPYPVVATSGNRSDEPIAIDNDEAADRLSGIADLFVNHNRPIARPCDDSVAGVSRRGVSLIRRARGYAPLPVPVPYDLPPVLAVGGHLKNTVAIAIGRQVFLSQHIGDLDTVEARRAFERAIDDLCRLYRFTPEAVVCDLHPDYASTRWAQASGLPVIGVQHHHAHVAGCAAENDVREPYLGVAWDGTGYGLDATVWGGEMFTVDGGLFDRVAHLRPFRLPGGEAAIKECWRCVAGIQFELGLPVDAPSLVRQMLERNLNSPLTTSVGRLFDAVAALTGLARENCFEGQAAMLLEQAIDGRCSDEAYPMTQGDWEPMIRAVLDDVHRGAAPGEISLRFHNALAEWILEAAREFGASRIIGLSGGVFQNRYLTERAAALLEADGFRVVTHQRVPANDGGIALGQAVLAAAAWPPDQNHHVPSDSR